MSEGVLKETAGAYRTGEFRSEFAPLIDELYREEVLDARRMDPEEKLILGERLFRWACAITLEGIKLQHPEASEADCQRMLRERVELGHKLETR